MTDGDTLFALATARSGIDGHLGVIVALAAEVTTRAVLNAVRSATGHAPPPLPAWAELQPSPNR